jgi:hypothetical protein
MTMITVSYITFITIKYATAPVKLLLAEGTKVPSLQRYLRKKACLSNSTSMHFVDYVSIYPDFFAFIPRPAPFMTQTGPAYV